MERWNGVALIPSRAPLATPLMSDASWSWGCGAYWGNKWFQWQWAGPSQESDIALKELLPVLIVLVVWGRKWVGHGVECYCDNMAVVAVVNSGRAKDKKLMHLLKCMFFVVGPL